MYHSSYKISYIVVKLMLEFNINWFLVSTMLCILREIGLLGSTQLHMMQKYNIRKSSFLVAFVPSIQECFVELHFRLMYRMEPRAPYKLITRTSLGWRLRDYGILNSWSENVR